MDPQETENSLLKIIRSDLESLPIFEGYSVKEQVVQRIKSPTVSIFYDTTLESTLANRWLFVRISDFYKYQKVIIWVNNLNSPEPVNFDLEKYFIEKLKIKNVAQKMTFKSMNHNVFKERFRDVLKFISDNIDEKGKLLLSGHLWLDMPFDWQGYK